VPQLVKRSGGSGGGSGPTVTGNNNTITFNYGNTFVTNVNVFATEYEAQTGRPLSDDLRKQIQAAVTAAQQNNHAESIRLLEQVAKTAPVPAIYNNLGVEYEQAKNPEASRRAFELSKAKIAELTSPQTKSGPRPSATPPPVSGAAIRTEASGVAAMTIDPISAPYEAPSGIDVVVHGASLRGYRPKYEPKPGIPVAMEPGAYDVVLRAGSGAGFVVASNVEIKDGMLTHINPNALVGGIAVESATKKGFPVINELQFVKDQLVVQQTERLGLTLPIAPGSYDVVVIAAGDQVVRIADGVTVTAGAITRLNPLDLVSAIVVYKPNLADLDMKAIYALNAGTNQIAAKVAAWEVPMLVRAGVAYDIGLDQAAGLTRHRKNLTPGGGEVVEIR